MTRSQLLPHRVNSEVRADGSILLTSQYKLGEVAANTGKWLHRWASQNPERTFIAERSGSGWRKVSFGQTLQLARAIGSALLSRGLDQKSPILIISGNGVDHGIMKLAAQYVGVPTVSVAEQYSLVPAAHGRLKHVVDLVRPKLVFCDDGERFRQALELDFLDGIEKTASRPGSLCVTSFDELCRGDCDAEVETAHSRVGPSTVAKILMTSGSTSLPKGVETTQQMLCVNQAQMAAVLPFISVRPPRILDWLPWNHTFGGSANFNMMLANGGALYIDDGKPVKGLFGRSLENLSKVAGTLSFNVPVGFSMLAEALRNDRQLQEKYFRDLDMIFYAGASLPLPVWRELERMASEIRGDIPLLTSSWGLTETAPSATLQHEQPGGPGIIGVPLPGVTAKLIPLDDNRFEIRVKGPNILKRYFKAPEQTAQAFDEERFFKPGDAMKFVDPGNPAAGLRFDGRLSEDFKLLTGTWVRAAELRLELLRVLEGLATDLMIVGRDRSDIGLLIVPFAGQSGSRSRESCGSNGLIDDRRLLDDIEARLKEFNLEHATTSTRIVRAAVLAELPSMAEGEMTAKGNLNFNKLQQTRSALIDRLYDDDGEGATDTAIIHTGKTS